MNLYTISAMLEAFAALVGLMLGAISGSAYLCWRTRKEVGERWTGMERSHCDSCGHRLAWYDLLPIVSYLSLRGKCRYCGADITGDCLRVELKVGLAGMVLGYVVCAALLRIYPIAPICLMAVIAVASAIILHKLKKKK